MFSAVNHKKYKNSKCVSLLQLQVDQISLRSRDQGKELTFVAVLICCTFEVGVFCSCTSPQLEHVCKLTTDQIRKQG